MNPRWSIRTWSGRPGESGWHLRPRMILAVFILLMPYAVSYGDAGVAFTLINRTPYYLHAVINNETIVYIPPGVAVTRETGSDANVTAEVRYSPGQGISGSALRTFQAVVHTVGTGASTTNQTNDCSNSEANTCESSTSSTGSYSSTTTVDPITWAVTADTLTGD